MADKKITELPFITDVTASVGSSPSNTTVIPVVLYGTTNQITADNLKENFIRNLRGTVKDIQTYTSSLKGAVTVRGNGIEVAGNLEVQGNMSVKGTLYTQYETSSIIYTSGSTKFGNSFDDLHETTGSVFFTGSHTINGEDYTYYSSSNSAVFTNFSSSNSTAITAFSSSNSTLFTTYSSSNSTLFTNFSSSNSSYNTTFSSSNATYVTALSSSNSSYNTTFSSSNSTYNTTFSSSNATYVTALSSSNSTTFTNYSSSESTVFTNYSSSNSTTFTNYSSSTANTINGLSSGVSSELARVYQATASIQAQTASLLAFTASQVDRNTNLSIVTGSLNNFTASQDSRNFVISQYTSSTDAHIVGISAFTSSQLAVNLGISQVTASLIGITNTLMGFTASLDNTYATDAQLYQLYQATRSIELHSGSMIGITNGLMAYTSSNETWKTGVRGEIDGVESYTASLKAAAIVSSSTQIQNYDLFALNSNLYVATGSIKGEIAGIESYTASLKAQTIVSSSTQVINYNLFALTASANTFYGTQSVTGSVRISGSIDDIKYIDFDTVEPATGIARLGWDTGEGTLTIGLSGGNVNIPIGVTSFETAYNEDSSSISKGDVVRISGAQGNRVAIKKANNLNDDGSATTIAVAAETIGVGAEGKILTTGPLKGINTTAFNEGDLLYLSSTPGGITNIKPHAPYHAVRIGVAQRISATVGIVNIKVDNGYELDELHNLLIHTASLANKQLLAYSGSVWANQTISELGIAETASLNPVLAYTASLKNAFTIAGNDVNFVGKITAQEIYTTFTTSSVLYQSGSTKFGDDTGDKHAFTGSVKISGSFEVQGTGTGATVGDLLVDSANKYVYIGRQSATSGDNTTLVLRDRTGAARATLPGGSSTDTIFTTNASNFKVTNYSGTNLLNVSNLGNVTASGTFTIGGQTQIGTATTDTSLGSNTKFKVVGDGSANAGASQGSMFVAAGVTGGDTGLPVNMGTAGASMMLLASINTSTGTSTNAAQYLLHFYFDGNNLPNVMYVTGSSNWATFSVTSNNTLAISGSSSGNKSYAWWINKFGA